MQKNYQKPDLELLEFAFEERIMVDNDPSINIGDASEGEDEW